MSLRKTLGFVSETGYYLKESWKENASVPDLQMRWAQKTLERFNFNLEIVGSPAKDKSILFVGNHISYIDIAILMFAIPKVSFVAKRELSRWPVFGTAARAMNTIFVDRGCSSSRSNARDAIREGLKSEKRITIFPSGTTRLDESAPWRYGAFEIAKDANVRVQPFRLTYSHLRHAAYIDDDFFPFHIYNLASGPRVKVRLEFAEPEYLNDPRLDCDRIHKWARDLSPHKTSRLSLFKPHSIDSAFIMNKTEAVLNITTNFLRKVSNSF